MNNTIKLLGITFFGAAVLAACGDDTTGGGGSGGSTGGNGGTPATGGGGSNPSGGNGGTGGDGGNGGAPPVFPPAPEVGPQIDRLGRPAINTALNGAFVQFNSSGNKVAADATERGVLQDGYNEDSTQADWATNYGTLFAANLAMLDALDTGLAGTTNAIACTNQFGHSGVLGDPNTTAYGLLGTLVLPSDRLWLDTEGVGCSSLAPPAAEGYLAVEIKSLVPNTGCGGRRPIDDVIQTTFSAVAVGGLAGFDDGILARAGQHPETFPYLADPQ